MRSAGWRMAVGLAVVAAMTPATAAGATTAATPNTSARSFQENARHSGVVADPITAPLSRRWSVDVGGTVAGPLVVGGRVFAIVSSTVENHWSNDLIALDARTGRELWPRLAVQGGLLAYDNGTLFVLGGALRAVDATTGLQKWAVQNGLPTAVNGASMVAAGGRLYLTNEGVVQVVSESSGKVISRWDLGSVWAGMPAVDDTSLYVTDMARHAAAVDLGTGAIRWTHDEGQYSGPTTAVVGNGTMWLPGPTGLVGVRTSDGATLGTITSYQWPADTYAVASNALYLSHDHSVAATSLTTWKPLWTSDFANTIHAPPVVTSRHVFALDDGGVLHVLDRARGNEVETWPLAVAPSASLGGATVAEGLLFVGYGNRLTAFGSAASAPPTAIAPQPKTAVTVPPASTGADTSVALQVGQNGAHHPVATGSTLALPLAKAWTHRFPGPVSYPLVDETGSVYVTSGSAAYRLRGSDGSIAWGPVTWGGTGDAKLAEAGGTLFGITPDGYVAALDAASGAIRWAGQFTGFDYGFQGYPAVANGIVFLHGYTAWGGLAVAIDAASGTLRWSTWVAPTNVSVAPAVDASSVYFTDVAQNTFALDQATGAQRWEYTRGESAGGMGSDELAGGKLYLMWGTSLNPATGAVIGLVPSSSRLIVKDGAAFVLNGGTLSAESTTSNRRRSWTFRGDGTVATAPVLANNLIFEVGTSGRVWALDEATGAVQWSASTGRTDALPGYFTNQDLVQPAVGHGMLLVPNGSLLTAFTGSQPVAAPAPTTASPLAGRNATVNATRPAPVHLGGSPALTYSPR